MSYLDTLIKDVKTELKNYTKLEFVVLVGSGYYDRINSTFSYTLTGNSMREILQEYARHNKNKTNELPMNLLDKGSTLHKHMEEKHIDWNIEKMLTDIGWTSTKEDLQTQIHENFWMSRVTAISNDIIFYACNFLPEDFLVEAINKNWVEFTDAEFFIEKSHPILDFFKIARVFQP
jgi:hypothetical protein